MRINPDNSPDLLAALSQTQEQQNTAELQIGTGLRINKPSDDPAGAAALTFIHDYSSQSDSFLHSIGDVEGQMQVADSTLNSAVLAIQRAMTLGVEGATGTLSDDNRAAIADEVSGIRQQLVSLANVSYQGRFIFSGTAQQQPFVEDASQSSNVRYDGNTGVNQVSIGIGYQLQVNLPGSQVFSAAGSDAFQALTDLINALKDNTGIDTANTELRAAFDNLTSQRVFYGNALNQLNSQQTYLNNEKLQLSSQENSVAGVDMAAAASQLVNSTNSRNAALAAVGKSNQNNLFDYL